MSAVQIRYRPPCFRLVFRKVRQQNKVRSPRWLSGPFHCSCPRPRNCPEKQVGIAGPGYFVASPSMSPRDVHRSAGKGCTSPPVPVGVLCAALDRKLFGHLDQLRFFRRQDIENSWPFRNKVPACLGPEANKAGDGFCIDPVGLAPGAGFCAKALTRARLPGSNPTRQNRQPLRLRTAGPI